MESAEHNITNKNRRTKFVKDKPSYTITTYVFHSLKSILQSHDSGRHEKYRLNRTQFKKFNQRKILG